MAISSINGRSNLPQVVGQRSFVTRDGSYHREVEKSELGLQRAGERVRRVTYSVSFEEQTRAYQMLAEAEQAAVALALEVESERSVANPNKTQQYSRQQRMAVLGSLMIDVIA
ncbi:hypothetical protein BVY02_00645 [bacterium J17]|nr:hypothetical protein BVY02_00645 [bacterium J17]